ncbi:MAG TPA: FAD-dependent oxidoreductase [Rhizomicrobium sp.]|nr:FAD-dependent oxidoreductase [Rhizomicrobium sp.]
MDRRHLLKNSLGLIGLGATSQTAVAQNARVPLMDRPPRLAPIRAHVDRIYDMKSCLRPFRTKGPNLGVERIGDATVIHNYGHYGSGWCLSWGSADLQVQKAMSFSPKKIAVIGSGIIGLTSAVVALRAGAQVTIYTRELLPRTRSYRANGVWGPGTVALASEAPANLGDIWEHMVRISWKNFRPYMGMAGNPIAWSDHYTLSDTPFDAPPPPLPPMANGQARPEFYNMGNRASDLDAKPEVLTPEINPFPVKYGNRATKMFFNFSEYGYLLTSEFFARGGKIVIRDFHAPDELAHLPEKIIINCPGYAAHDWWKDKAMIPVRGQTEWLIPQPEVNYGFTYRNVECRSKSDGVMVIAIGPEQFAKSWNNGNEIPDRAEAEGAVKVVEELFSRFPANPV